jgi:hypothetical protein
MREANLLDSIEASVEASPWWFKIVFFGVVVVAISYCFATLAMPWRIGHIKDGVDKIKEDVDRIESTVREIQVKLKDLERHK